MTKREQQWQENYNLLKEYVTEHHQFPNKKKMDKRALLNWWKYNKKRIKEGKIEPDKKRLLMELSDMRDIHL